MQVKHAVPKEAMRFIKALHFLLDCMIEAVSDLGSTYLGKFNLVGAYMHILVRLKYIPSVAFLVPREKEDNPQLVDFRLSIPMVYLESPPVFCATTEMVKDQVKNTLQEQVYAPFYPIEELLNTG